MQQVTDDGIGITPALLPKIFDLSCTAVRSPLTSGLEAGSTFDNGDAAKLLEMILRRQASMTFWSTLERARA